MNRIENIILTLATAAALMVASTANANPDPCPTTGKQNDRPATGLSEDPRDGLLGEPRVKTETGTRTVRDIENERANSDSGTRPEDGLPGIPRVKTPTGTRLARDVNAERIMSGKNPCPTDGRKTHDVDRTRTRAANEAGSLLKHNGPVLPNPNGTRTKDGELNDRNQMMDGLKNAANNNNDNNSKKNTANTTHDDALKRAGIDPSELDGAKTEDFGDGMTRITLADGTVILTGPDSDGLGTSVTKKNGDQTEVYPDGKVSTRKGKDGNTITHHPNGTTTLYDPKQDALTVVDKHGRTITRPLDFFKQWYIKGYPADKILDLLDPRPGQKDPNNTTLDDTLRRAGVSKDDLKGATKVETNGYDSGVKITLKDGTEIWTGPDSDGSGSSATRPNGDQVEVFPDGRVSTRKGKNGHTVTTHPDGLTTDYDPTDDTLTVRDDNGNSETRTMEFWNDWYKDGHTPADLFRLYNDMPNNK